MASKSGQLPAAAAAAALSADSDEDEDVVVMEEPEDSDAEEDVASNMDDDDDDDDDEDGDNENSDSDVDNEDEEDADEDEDDVKQAGGAASASASAGSRDGGSDDDDDDDEEGSDIDDDDDGDKKPAAKSSADEGDSVEEVSSSEEEESDDDDDDDDSSDNGDGDDGEGEEPTFVTVTDEFGNERTVSAYEAARIERIRRNKERLASLGLEGSSRDGRRGSTSSGGGGGTLLSAHTAEMDRKKEERRKKREQRKRELAEMRESDRRSSSRKRKQVSYTEMKESGVDGGRKSDGSGRKSSSSASNREVSKWRTERPREQRVPLFIFKELRRVESDRKKNLKRAERNSRAADIEHRFAQKNAARVEKAIRRREELEHHRRQWMERQQEKKELQEFFRSIDDRKNELIQARSVFDQERYAEMHRRSRNYLDHNRAKFDALSRFPMAVLETERHLDALLLQQCPNDDRALVRMSASLTPGTGPKRSRKKKKARDADDGLGSPMRGAVASTGSATPSGQVHPAGSSAAIGSTPGSVSQTAASTEGVPLNTPVTGMLHPSAAPQVFAVQEKTLQKAMARLIANNGGAEGQMLPPSASGYPNLTGRVALPPIAEKANSKKKKSAKEKNSDKGDGGDNAGDLKDAAKSAPDKAKKVKHAIRKRNVGGPVPPEYAKAIQRNWLDNDDVLMPDSTKQFIPQAGDLVLYYPRGHKEFLATHADHLGNKTRQVLRLPLWERAKKEKAGSNKESEGKSDDTKPSAVEAEAEQDTRASRRRAKGKPARLRDAEKEKEGETKKTGSKKKKDGSSSSQWWNEEWLASMESDVGGECPILCRVENTTAEFPYNKGAVDIATNRKTSWSMQIDKKKKDEIRKQLAKKRPMLRVAVSLKPLTPIVSSSSADAGEEESLDLPPPFVAQCFPSKSVNPFVLPFFWTYRHTHSLAFGDKVRVQFDDDIYTGKHEALVDNSCSLENAFKRFPEIFEDGSNMPVDQRLERLLAVASAEKNASIPLEETRAVLQFVSHYWHQKQEKGSGGGGDGKVNASDTNAATGDLRYSTLVDFICATLPRWDNALIRWDASEGEKEADISAINPWEPFLEDSSKASAAYPGCRPGDLVYSLGGKLLENVRLSIQRYVDENPDSAALLAQVDTTKTPEYGQHVPLPMSIQRVLTRLEQRPLKRGASLMSEELTTNDKLCWYRSVAAVVSDLHDIAHNFVLYSELTSDILKVRSAVDNLKHLAENLDSNAQRKRLKKESVGKASGQMMLWQGQMEGVEVKEKDPFLAPLRRMWAQEIVQDCSWGETISPRLLDKEGGAGSVRVRVRMHSDGTAVALKDTPSKVSTAAPEQSDLNSWVPQVGDEIFYSRDEHSKFLRGHFAALSEIQRVMPSIVPQQTQGQQGDGTDSNSSSQVSNGWLVGVVSSIHARFPPLPPADDDAAIANRSFDDLTPILEVGIYFNYPWLAQKLQIIHWRPCQVHGSDPAYKAPRKKTKAKPTYRPIRVKALVKKKDVYPGRQLYFKPQALKKNPRLARALGIKKQAVRINVQLNGKNVAPPTKKAKSLIIDRKMFMQDEELYLALYGDNATKPARITVKIDGKSVSPKPILLPPSIVDSVDGLSDALENSGVGQYSSTPIYVKVDDQKVLRKPIMLPPYVVEKVSGLAEAIGSVRRAPEAETSDTDDADDDAAATTTKSDPLIGETETGQCTCCGLDSEVSFLRPAWIQPTRYNIVTPLPPPSFASPPGISSEISSNILRLLEIMKQRSIEGIPPDSVRPEAFVDGAVSGRKRSASFVSTQAAALTMPETEREALAKLHYLPPWFIDNGNDEVREGIRKSDAYLPLPYLCLDLVQRRIKQGYYRSLIGATHDIREAYVATVIYLLKSEGVESLKRMAVLLAHRSYPSLMQAEPAEASATGNARKKKKKSGDVSTHTFLFGVRVTIKEAALFRRIEQVRKLYGAALTCFTHTIVVETALGKERKGPSIEKVTVNELVTYYRKMEIRRKICHLLDVIYPDPCRLRRSIRGYQPNPSVRIKISLGETGDDSAPVSGVGAQGGDEAAAAPAAPSQATSEGELVPASEVEVLDVHQESEESEVDLSQPLLFQPDDYLRSNDLVRALFGTTGRMEACVRCQKAKRGMFTCRVVRAHSIEDFDLDELLGGRGIDGLIHDLLSRSDAHPASSSLEASKPDDNEEVDTAPNKDGTGEDTAVSPEEQSPEEADTVAKTAEDTQGDNEAATSTNNDAAEAAQADNSQEHALTEAERAAQAAAVEEEAKEKRMLEAFKQAQLAVQLAKQNLVAANAAMDVPPALSKEFVKTFFPYDHADGHYEICVACGLGGDILCCETCPNVAHTYCAGLAKVPEGDWYCCECVAVGKGPAPVESTGAKEDTPADADPMEVDKPTEGADTDAGADADADAEAEAEPNADADVKPTTERDAQPAAPKGDDQMGDADVDPDADAQTKSKDDAKSESNEAKKDPTDDQEVAASAEPLEAATEELSNADDSSKKVSFEVDSSEAGPSNSASTEATSPNGPPGNWPLEEKRFDEEYEEKAETLENILNELKSLRQKPKPASQGKQTEEEEKKADDEADDDDSDADDDTSTRRSRRRSTKVVKRPKRKRPVLELGTKILKEFEGHGDFEGIIEAAPDSDDEYQEYYRVRYLDGDEEDVSENEAYACVEYWKKSQAKKEPDDPNVRRRRKPMRFETIQAAAELKGSRKKNRLKGGGSPSRGRLSTFKECAVKGCTKQSQGRANDHMCRRHYTQTQRGETPTVDSSTPSNGKKGTPKKNTPSGRATSTRKRGRRKVEEYDDEEVEEEEEEEEEEAFVPSPRAKRARRGRRNDFNLDGGPHRRPRGKLPEGKLWDSHHGAWVDE